MLISPIAYLDPLRCSQVCLLASLFHDALNEFTYAAEVAGLGYALQSTKYGLQVMLHLLVFLFKIIFNAYSCQFICKAESQGLQR